MKQLKTLLKQEYLCRKVSFLVFEEYTLDLIKHIFIEKNYGTVSNNEVPLVFPFFYEHVILS
jgi:hypothetical protein